jgi:glycerophosphoryl diester phosphodiesterase
MDAPEHGKHPLSLRPVERIAHRGAKREFPENSLPAFRRAFERGAKGIELDVHATADGVVVVHHDPDIRARGPLNRFLRRPIAELESAQLERTELAPGVGIPTLADVLAGVPKGGSVYVEIKASNIEQLVADVIRASSTVCAVHSFDHSAIARLGEIAPEIPRGILFEKRSLDLRAAMDATGARDVWPQWKLVDESLVAAVHAAGGRVIPWTVNARAEASRLVDLGVDGLCGDDVREFTELAH